MTLHERRVRAAAGRLFKEFHISDRCMGDCSCNQERKFTEAFVREVERVSTPTGREGREQFVGDIEGELLSAGGRR